jgi:hypothetical protein
MNKKIIISCILGISTMMLMTGCGRQTEEPQDEIEVISVNIDEDTPNITEMSKSKILSLSASEVKQSVETYLPNYRTIYKISNSKVMTDEDWLNLRDIICIQFYGNATLDTTSSSNSTDNNAKYYNPDKESIKKMSASEFATYMNGLYTYMYGKDYLTSNNIDFTQYSEDKINILKQDFLNNLDKTN